MTRRVRPRTGFTLVEVMLSMALASIVMLGLSYVMVPLARAELLARGQTSQLNLSAALRTADREISQASWLLTPSLPGIPDDRLEGCQNAMPPSGAVPSAPIDPGQPVRWFALCPLKGRLYYHTGGGCPPVYACGSEPASEFGGGPKSQVQASFTRASPYTTVVEISLNMTSSGTSENLRSAAAFAGAAGRSQ